MKEYERIRYALARAREYVKLGDLFLARLMTETAEKNLLRLRAKATRRFARFTISLEDSNG